MRTTINVDDDLLREVKGVAVRSGKSMNDVIEDALRESLARRRDQGKGPTRPMPRFHGGPPFPGVDLNSWASLLDRDDADDTP